MKISGRQNYKAGSKDECGSPPYAVMPLINALERYRKRRTTPKDEFVIWEPATGMNLDRPLTGLATGLQRLGYKVFAPRGVDFVTADLNDADEVCLKNLGHKISMVITNPPFSVRLKRLFINKCEQLFFQSDLPYCLLMNTTTLTEKINGKTLHSCAIHVPYGRICFDMPDKGWGTKEKPTMATFSTAWFSKGIYVPYSINYSLFDMSDHFKAMERFDNIVRRLTL